MRDPRDLALLLELHRSYVRLAERAYEHVCGAGGFALSPHTYGPRTMAIERIDDTTWKATMAAKVGPVSARFNGTMKILESRPPDGYTLHFEGQGGAAGFANGDAKVTLRVVEMTPDGTAKVGYEENEVTASWPPKVPKEGRPSIGDRRTYVELVKELATEVCKRFVPYEEEQ